MTTKSRLFWMAGSIGTGVFSTVPSVLLLYFLTQTLRLPVLLASLAIFLPKAASVILDPLIGRWSDRVVQMRGRRPFLLAGAPAAGLTLALLFCVPQLGSPASTALLAAAVYLAAVFAFGLFSVPYIAMPAEMIADPAARTGLISQRMVLVALGIIAGGAGGPALIALGGGGAGGYRAMGVVLGGVVTTVMLMAALARVPPVAARDRVVNVVAFQPLRETGYARLLGGYFLAQLAAGTGSATLPYLVIGVNGGTQSTLGLLLLLMLGSGAVASVPWGWLAVRAGRRVSLQLALALGVVGMGVLGTTTIATGSCVGAGGAVGLVLIGVGSAGVQVLAFSQLAAIVDHAETSGRFSGGQLTGLMTAVEKVALAGGPLVAGVTFSVVGVITAHLSKADLGGVAIAVTVIPAVLLSLALIVAGGGRSKATKSSQGLSS